MVVISEVDGEINITHHPYFELMVSYIHGNQNTCLLSTINSPLLLLQPPPAAPPKPKAHDRLSNHTYMQYAKVKNSGRKKNIPRNDPTSKRKESPKLHVVIHSLQLLYLHPFPQPFELHHTLPLTLLSTMRDRPPSTLLPRSLAYLEHGTLRRYLRWHASFRLRALE